jgi:hypothetical protein
MRVDRKRHRWPWTRRLWREFVWHWDLDDGSGDGSPSLTKIIALLFAFTVVVSVIFSLAISGNQVWMALAAAAIAFGRSTFRALVTRSSWAGTASDTTARVEQRIRQEIIERRALGAEDDSEPT